MKLRLSWQGDAALGEVPLPGHYLMTPRGRGGYLVLGVRNSGRRGGLGRPMVTILIVTAERVSRAEAEAGYVHSFFWHPRSRRATPI